MYNVTDFIFMNFIVCNNQSPNFDDMSSIFPCKIDDAIQYSINLGYGVQAPKILIL